MKVAINENVIKVSIGASSIITVVISTPSIIRVIGFQGTGDIDGGTL